MKSKLIFILAAALASWGIRAALNPHITELYLNIDGVADYDEFYEPSPSITPKGPGGFVCSNGWKKITLKAVGVNEPMKTRLNWDSAKIEVWTATNGGTQVLSPTNYSPASSMPTQLWVKGVSPSATGPAKDASGNWTNCGPEHITLEAINNGADPTTPGTYYDRVAFTVVAVEFVRLWDVHRIANRTTRAMDPELRLSKTYEDSERSDGASADNSPLLVLGGWCNDMTAADVKLNCSFQPATAGGSVLWKINAFGGSVDGASSGTFATNDIISLRLLPSMESMATRRAKDFIVKIGIDQNGDTFLSDTEAFPIEWGIRVIGKGEYDQCRDGLPAWQIALGWFLYPDTTDFLDIFLDKDSIVSYQQDDPDTVSFSGSYDQRNGLGCSPYSLTQGHVRRYTWDNTSAIRKRVLLSDSMWNDAIQPTISAMGIGTWYADPANASINSKTFTGIINMVVYFSSSENLVNSLGHAYVNIEVTIDTERATPKPKITAMRIDGTVTDLYDFATVTTDDHLGYASRIQVCHAPSCERTAGEIFKVRISCETPRFTFIDYDYDDFTNLRGELGFNILFGFH